MNSVMVLEIFFWSHNASSCHFYLTCLLFINYIFPFCVLGIVCVCMCICLSLHVCVSGDSFVCFSPFIFSILVFCLFVCLFACLFSKKRNKMWSRDGWGGGEDLGGSEEGETVTRIYCMKRICFQFYKRFQMSWQRECWQACPGILKRLPHWFIHELLWGRSSPYILFGKDAIAITKYLMLKRLLKLFYLLSVWATRKARVSLRDFKL